MKWFLKRLGEASGMASVSALSSAGYGIIYGAMPLELAIPAILGAVLGFVMPERGNNG